MKKAAFRIAIGMMALAWVAAPYAATQQQAPTASSSSAAEAPAAHSSFFNHLTRHLPLPWHNRDAPPSQAQNVSQTADAPDVMASLSQRTGVRIVDIQTLSNRADQVVDPTCKVIVRPSNPLGSSLSLTAFAAKLELQQHLGIGNGGGTRMLIRRAAIQLDWLPATAELLLGRRLLAQDSAEILPSDRNRLSRLAYAHADATLKQVIAQLHMQLPYTFHIFVLKEAQGNASSLPGGTVLVDQDVVGRHWDPDWAFFIVAHEVSHVLQRHETHAYQAAMVDSFDQVSQLRNLLVQINRQSPMMVVNQLWNFKSLIINFSSQEELQADACAVRLMRDRFSQRAQLDAALRDVLSNFPPAVSGSDHSMQPKDAQELLKSLTNGIYERHPDSAQRRQNIISVLGQLKT